MAYPVISDYTGLGCGVNPANIEFQCMIDTLGGFGPQYANGHISYDAARDVLNFYYADGSPWFDNAAGCQSYCVNYSSGGPDPSPSPGGGTSTSIGLPVATGIADASNGITGIGGSLLALSMGLVAAVVLQKYFRK